MHQREAGRADAWRLSSSSRLLAALVIAILLPSAALAAADPVTNFIVRADSIAQLGDEDALRRFVAENVVVTGAAVGQLLDAAIEAGEGGDAQGESDNIAFAERLALLYEKAAGSRAPYDVVSRYRSWKADDRDARRKAKTAEKRSAEAKSAGDLDGAVALLEEARAVYEAIGDKRSEAVVWGSLGVAHWARGDTDAVIASYEKALTARRAIEDRILEGRTLNGLGSANYQKGRYEAAADFYRQAVDLRRRTGDLGGLATSLTYLGNACVQIGRLIDARDEYEEALEILGSSGDPRQRFEVTNSIGNLYFEMGRMRNATETYSGALEIAVAAADTLGEITCRNNLANSLVREYRYREALEELDTVRELLRAHPDPLQTLMFHRNSGMAQLALGEVDLARDDLLAFLREAEKQEAAVYQIEALKSLGYLYEEVGASDRGLEYAEKAMTLATQAGHEKMLRDTEMLAAQLETDLARYESALGHWQAALEKDRRAGADARIIEDELGIANVYAIQGRPEDARKIYQGLQPLVEQAGFGDAVLALSFGIADTWEKANPDSARHYYEHALSILERTRSSLGGSETRVGYLGGTRRYYYEEVARYYASLSRGDDSGEWSSLAFETIERAKARGLLDLLEAPVLAEGSPAEEAVLDSLYRLDRASPRFKEEEQALRNRYSDLREKRWSESIGRLGAKSAIVGFDEIRKRIPKDAAMLAYALGDTVSLLWVIDRKGHDLIELPNRETIRPVVSRLRDAIARPGSGDAALKSAARTLYKILVEPASPRLQNKKKLIIVPDGFLFEIPYEVLLTDDTEELAKTGETDATEGAGETGKAGETRVTEEAGETGETAGWSDLPFLARSFSAVYAPSASVYVSLARSARANDYDLDLLALGDPDYSTQAGGGTAAGPLEALPFSRVEVEAIASVVKPDREEVLLGPAASEAALKDRLRTGSSRILHLAAHGLVDPAEPTRSCIALCPGSGDDGYYYTLEILSVPVAARLVVLSACESGTGRLSRGEGVVGMSRSFIGAGAGAVVASLWKVSDESTSTLMQEFYDRMIRKKQPAAEALNGARLALMKKTEYGHPFHWSPFVVIGSDRAPW